ncbi:MAG: hypothetical protein ACPKNR_02785 [Pleomorphochaeta sp.]
MIKIDLHIHSDKSKYKEEDSIVDDSTIENIDILLNKLDENNISMFSITDHNLLNSELYKVIQLKLKENNKYKFLKTIITGVEFDVRFEEDKKKCHVLTYFDIGHKLEKYEEIDKILAAKKPKIDTVYSQDEFYNILKEIGLNTILIACQRKSINNEKGNSNSISDSVSDLYEKILVGYIDGFEYQKPKVEGILLNDLKKLPRSVGLISGSDCHTWLAYPRHDFSSPDIDFKHTKVNCLPTFKGLMMAVTSPETRFIRSENKNIVFIKDIEIGGVKINLVNGINVIIGENGAGKSLILKTLYDIKELKKTWEKNLIKGNLIKVDNLIDKSQIKYVKQSEIIERYHSTKNLFENDLGNYLDIDDTDFKEKINVYTQQLYKLICSSIDNKKAIDKLKDCYFKFDFELENKTTFYININENLNILSNKHIEPLKKINKLKDDLEAILKNDYYIDYKENLLKIKNELDNIYNKIQKEFILEENNNSIKNIIIESVKDYNVHCKQDSTNADCEINDYKDTKKEFINNIFDAIIKNHYYEEIKVEFPLIAVSKGFTQNPVNGFYFNVEKNYNDKDENVEILKYLFVKDYCDIEKIKSINTTEAFRDAIKGCTENINIEKSWEENINSFLKKETVENRYITSANNKKIGNTLGEMSLSFFKFISTCTNAWNILLIDQPEDNISNKKIKEDLINIFGFLRGKKQLIIVTHNPLLVVNLDAENVIYLKNVDDKIIVKSGALEFEDEETNMIDIIVNNMDGGLEAIRKRMKVYGKYN